MANGNSNGNGNGNGNISMSKVGTQVVGAVASLIAVALVTNAWLTWEGVNKLTTWKDAVHPIEVELNNRQMMTTVLTNQESLVRVQADVLRLSVDINELQDILEELENRLEDLE